MAERLMAYGGARSAVARVGAAALVAVLGSLAPVPAAAQVLVPPDKGGVYAKPPPVDRSLLPADTGKPDKPYEKKVECVVRDLDKNINLTNKPWGQQYLQIDQVHLLMRSATGAVGKGVKVAVIDTGVNQHDYLAGRLEGGGDYVKEEHKGLEDCDGHGTEVAGIIAANTPADIGFRGVAPDATIVSIRQSSQNYGPPDKTSTTPPPASPSPSPPGPGQPPPSGQPSPPPPGSSSPPPSPTQLPPEQSAGLTGEQGTAPVQQGGRQQEDAGAAGNVETLAQAVRRAADLGAKVINMSVDNCRPATGTATIGEKKLQAAVNYAVNQKDAVVIAAAGNTSQECEQNNQPDPNLPKTIVTPPWFADDVLSVGAIDRNGSPAEFSVHGPWVGVAAPGTEIISLDPAKGSGRQLANQMIENNQPIDIQGTSFAAPYVSGVAALVRAKYPTLNARQVMNRITSTAQHPGAADGRDQYVGYGVVNPMAALTAIIPAEEKIPAATPIQLPSDLPPPSPHSWTPMIVALAGAGGGLAALLITLFTVHTLRRNRPTP